MGRRKDAKTRFAEAVAELGVAKARDYLDFFAIANSDTLPVRQPKKDFTLKKVKQDQEKQPA
jgi:hypothetical protein